MSKKAFTGKVIGTKMTGTVSVLVSTSKKHPLYKKTMPYSKKYLVSDSLGVKEGDIVTIEATRPISKKVHFVIKEKLSEAKK